MFLVEFYLDGGEKEKALGNLKEAEGLFPGKGDGLLAGQDTDINGEGLFKEKYGSIFPSRRNPYCTYSFLKSADFSF